MNSSGRVVVLQGDAAHLPLPDASVDAIVCDPPYGLAELPAALVAEVIAAWISGDRLATPKIKGFMGRDWDGFVPPPGEWDEAFRVLKPGGHLLAFAGARTQDLMGLSIRLAGFEIREGLSWMFGGGMPKSLNVSKAIDKAAGAARPVIAEGAPAKRMIPGATQNATGSWLKDDGREYVPQQTAPATEDATAWNGWGTGLRPSHEPIILARKPLACTVARNVLEHGTGAINIDACRMAAAPGDYEHPGNENRHETTTVYNRFQREGRQAPPHGAGRWPPNVMLSHLPDCEPSGMREVRSNGHHPGRRGESGYEGGLAGQEALSERSAGLETVEAWSCAEGCPVAELDRQSGGTRSSAGGSVQRELTSRGYKGGGIGQRRSVNHDLVEGVTKPGYADAGGASRFFPVFRYEAKADAAERPRLPDGTVWPTVKPVALIRWLLRLVVQPGGTLLDMYCGTGTTGQAALIEGFDAILIDKDPQAIELTRVRLAKPVQPVMFSLEAS